MKIMDDGLERRIQSDIVSILLQQDYDLAARNISVILDELYANIPDEKRISYGTVFTIKLLSEHLYGRLDAMNTPVYEIASKIFKGDYNFKSRGVALGVLSFYGLKDYKKVLPYFESAASSYDWNMREFAQMFFRKLTKKYPDETGEYLLKLSKSSDENIRRFVSETLRPVRENEWIFQNPDYSLLILRNLFKEPSAYPRTSVGNNLSDLARKKPELVCDLIKKLVESGDDNSYWIAYRACRNLVKEEPVKIMDLLNIDEYKYKKRIYRKSDYQRS